MTGLSVSPDMTPGGSQPSAVPVPPQRRDKLYHTTLFSRAVHQIASYLYPDFLAWFLASRSVKHEVGPAGDTKPIKLQSSDDHDVRDPR